MRILTSILLVVIVAFAVITITGCPPEESAPPPPPMPPPPTWSQSAPLNITLPPATSNPIVWTKESEKTLTYNCDDSWYHFTGVTDAEVGVLILFCAVAEDGSPVVVVIRNGVNNKPANFRFENSGFNFVRRPVLTHYVSNTGDEYYVARGPFRQGPNKVIEKP